MFKVVRLDIHWMMMNHGKQYILMFEKTKETEVQNDNVNVFQETFETVRN